MRLARLIELISVIKYHSDWGPKKLAEYFEISEKRIYDDLNELNAANIPIVYNGKGYSFLSRTSLPPVNFTLDEALALIMCSTLIQGHNDDVYSVLVRGASNKLIGLLPEDSQKKLVALEGKVKVGSQGSPELNHALKKSNTAISESRRLSFDYFSYSSDKTSNRVVDPYGVIFRGNSWYLIAYCHTRNEIRTFRINRLSKIKITPDFFVYPDDFSVEKYIEKSWSVFQGEETEVEILFSKKLAPLISEHSWHPDQSIEKHKDGSITFRARVKGTFEIKRWILSWGNGVRVIKPDSLRKEIINSAESLIKENKKTRQ